MVASPPIPLPVATWGKADEICSIRVLRILTDAVEKGLEIGDEQ
jgi:hypothetical protein